MKGSVHVGTSGFAYKEWRPGFYPEGLPQKDFLGFYATRFSAVEIDYTFYRMPNRKTLESWSGVTGPKFRFALKASRRITHFERLRLPSDALDYLTGLLPVLGARLGVLLFQLPPNFKVDMERLRAFLDHLPPELPVAFEFRHESWFTGDVYSLLGGRAAGLVINDSDEGTTPLERTGPIVYVRMRRSVYDDAARRLWQSRFAEWSEAGGTVYAFVKHEDNPDAPASALAFGSGYD